MAPQARSDLLDIWDYIAEDSIDAADRITNKLLGTFAQLARHPHLGHVRHDLTREDVLFWPVGAYMVVYRARNEVLEIIAVARGSRDLPTLLLSR